MGFVAQGAKLLAILFFIRFNFIYGHQNESELVLIQRKPCPGGCGQRGHCNYEEGRCECPWGYTGPSCEVDRMAVCRQTPDDPGSCGYIMPKNCECYRECFRLYCHHSRDTNKCAHQGWANDLFDASCWLYGTEESGPSKDLPQTSSLYPEDPERETVWFGHFITVHVRPPNTYGHPTRTATQHVRPPNTQIPEVMGRNDYNDPELRLKDRDRRFKSPWDRPWLVWHRAPNVGQPLSRCKNRCSNGRGFCILRPGMEEPHCTCHYGYDGEDCSTETPAEACWFSPDCGGRGKCRSGFCQCIDGWWGMGCRRTLAYQPAVPGTIPDLRSKTRLKIYKYELPWEIAFPHEMSEDSHSRDNIYTAYELFMQYFLYDKVVRTENPYEANMFYVPALVYFYSDNVRNANWQSEVVINYIRKKWPFYNRTDGHDHFMFIPGDRGPCHTERWLQDGIIKVVHFGMQRQNLSWINIQNKDYGCIQVKRDLVVSPHTVNMGSLLPINSTEYYNWVLSNGGYDGNRTLLFFFAGGVGDGEYSGGARLAIKLLLANLTNMPPDVKFFEGRIGDDYHTLITTCKFCISPYGHGWGIRLVQAIHFGCIPVIIQDYVYQPYEDFLPYEEFSVRMRLADVPHMVEILRSYSEQQLANMRLAMAKYFRAFIWERQFGGRAYEWTLAGLQRRLYNKDAEYFH